MAIVALVLAAAAVAVVVVGLLRDSVGVVALVVLVPVAVLAGVYALVSRRLTRTVAGIVFALAIAGIVLALVTGEGHGLVLALLLVVVALAVGSARYALRRDVATLKQSPSPGLLVGGAKRGVLLINPKSGGGKADKFGLVDEAKRRNVEPVVLMPGDDLLHLAQEAVASGADVLGMAGGDGSQALVASVVMDHDVALVCVPAGTRNHFAADLGLDRDDVVGALDAFVEGRDRRIDLGTVGTRVFVNNVSLGFYAKVVQSPEYRDAKWATVQAMLPDLLGPDAEPFDLRFTSDAGVEVDGAQLIQVSNNPYALFRPDGFGYRVRLDTGRLGVVAVRIGGSGTRADLEWSATEFQVRSSAPVEAGVDGEALLLEPPLDFRCLPAALRVRIPTRAPGASPAAAALGGFRSTTSALFDVVKGRPPPAP